MSTLALPGPISEGGGENARKRSKPPPRESHIPTREEILETLNNLPALIATGFLTPAQANSMRGILKTMLDALPEDSPQAASDKQLDVPRLRNALRSHPDVLRAIAPLLSDARLRELSDDDDQADSGSDQTAAGEAPRPR
jgi:hypothetical protein